MKGGRKEVQDRFQAVVFWGFRRNLLKLILLLMENSLSQEHIA